ncbi:hypothetical protein ACIOG7_34490 [Streptomyces sp. NPDC087894]
MKLWAAFRLPAFTSGLPAGGVAGPAAAGAEMARKQCGQALSLVL